MLPNHYILHNLQLVKAIKDIENEMGTPLFDRSKRHLILTDAGQIFMRKVKKLLHYTIIYHLKWNA